MNNKRGFLDDSEYFPKKDPTETPKIISQTTHDKIKPQKIDKPLAEINFPQEMIPEFWSIDKMVIRNATDALQSGLEYAQECLATHDSSLGRTTKKNKSWAETIESDIRLIEKSIKELKVEEVSRTTHYP